MVLIRLAADIWAAQTEMKFPGMYLPCRMTIVRLRDGGLWVHSPLALDDAGWAEVDALGPVRWLVGPNLLHHLGLGAWQQRYPTAQLWGAPGLPAKRSDLTFAGELPREHDGNVMPWADELDTLPIEGAAKLNEVVFFHRATRTLVVTDLLMNLRNVRGWGAPIMLRLTGVHDRFAQSRIWRLGRPDRVALAHTAERLLALAPARVVPAHGEVLDPVDPQVLATTLTWMRSGAAGTAAPAPT